MLKNILTTLGGIVLLLIVLFSFSLREVKVVQETEAEPVGQSESEDADHNRREVPTAVGEMHNSTKTLQIGGQTLVVDVVSTPEERAQGLGGREGLAEGTGMLFVFEKSAIYPFWMKGMRFDIDILWISDDFEVVSLQEDAQASSYNAFQPWKSETFVPTAEALYVLEVNAGFARTHGIEIGDVIQISDI